MNTSWTKYLRWFGFTVNQQWEKHFTLFIQCVLVAHHWQNCGRNHALFTTSLTFLPAPRMKVLETLHRRYCARGHTCLRPAEFSSLIEVRPALWGVLLLVTIPFWHRWFDFLGTISANLSICRICCVERRLILSHGNGSYCWRSSNHHRTFLKRTTSGLSFHFSCLREQDGKL